LITISNTPSKVIIRAPPTTHIPIPTQSQEAEPDEAESLLLPEVLFRVTESSNEAASSTELDIAHIFTFVSMKSSSRFSRVEL
jgi:hypothetical protein